MKRNIYSGWSVKLSSDKAALIERLKAELKRYVPSMFYGFVDSTVNTNSEVLIQWLRKQKSLLLKILK